ncbi:SUMF1/EgtB/PvdO family nonheme iron enzyme [Candidatus Kaiserbacteria bacterium]|nr:SUMF1/EgtB/PvdO family nonheme iron enzyme [Candidatus Kaiserbacteria bacterium]
MKWGKVLAVVFGAVVITALGIDAADTISGSRSTLLGQLVSSQTGACPSGMVEVKMATTFSCVDKYESSPSTNCFIKDIQNEAEAKTNLGNENCSSDSLEKAKPWRFVTREQAQLLCYRSGKRLPTAAEWYQIALGTPDETEVCNVDDTSVIAGRNDSQCVSAVGAVNTIGNVWEWVSDDVINGIYNNREIPKSGYVTQVDSDGVAIVTEIEPENDQFGEDYFWSESDGNFGVLKGGFFGSQSDAGIYATHMQTVPTMFGVAIGFRCVQ